jgi:hypothetical protein
VAEQREEHLRHSNKHDLFEKVILFPDTLDQTRREKGAHGNEGRRKGAWNVVGRDFALETKRREVPGPGNRTENYSSFGHVSSWYFACETREVRLQAMGLLATGLPGFWMRMII